MVPICVLCFAQSCSPPDAVLNGLAYCTRIELNAGVNLESDKRQSISEPSELLGILEGETVNLDVLILSRFPTLEPAGIGSFLGIIQAVGKL